MSRTQVSFSMSALSTTLSRDEIVDYIAVGRSKVLGTKADPYRACSRPRRQMRRDARRILRWFQSQPKRSESAIKAYRAIVAIQRGPK